MVKKSFTLTEMMITLVILGALTTIALPVYRNVIEDAQAKVCQTNLKVLDAALNIYVMENDAMPGDLSDLSPRIVRKAYAQVMRQEDAWKIRLAYSIVGWQEGGLAYAGLLHDLARGDIKTLTCPADPTPPAQGGVSYGMNAILRNMRTQDFKALADDTVLIGDCKTPVFNDPSSMVARHAHVGILSRDDYSQEITKGKKIGVRGRSQGQGQGTNNPPGLNQGQRESNPVTTYTGPGSSSSSSSNQESQTSATGYDNQEHNPSYPYKVKQSKSNN